MKILTIGDVVGEAGLDALHALLRRIKRDTGADFVIVNGENTLHDRNLSNSQKFIAPDIVPVRFYLVIGYHAARLLSRFFR